MRKRLVCYGAFVILVLAIINLSCNRTSSNSLRIISINDNKPKRVDIIDRFVDDYGEEHELISDQHVSIEVGYVEKGLGLPTYPTNYTARVTDYRVKFKRIKIKPTDNDKWVLQDVTGTTNITIPADPELRNTVKANIKIIPWQWIEFYRDSFGEFEQGEGARLKATIILNGYEELTNTALSDTGWLDINIADYWDDPRTIGGVK
ncbi:MAG: hypothetical protein N2201_04250 [candidate division WOR-3 bacterium]|nr:hypothetical protein [candidate division WOR-3 bacterium]